MVLEERIANKLAIEYIWDYNDYIDYPNIYNSKIIDSWKEDFMKMDAYDKKALYAKITEKMKSCVDIENYEYAAIIRDALKNIEL